MPVFHDLDRLFIALLILVIGFTFAEESMADDYSRGWQDGYESGYESGYERGYADAESEYQSDLRDLAGEYTRHALLYGEGYRIDGIDLENLRRGEVPLGIKRLGLNLED